MTTEELASRVEACDFPAPAFKHRHHIELAWHYLRTLPLVDAITRFDTVISRFARHHGATNYDALLTVSYLLLIEHRRSRAANADFDTFAQSNPDLFTDGRALLARAFAVAS